MTKTIKYSQKRFLKSFVGVYVRFFADSETFFYNVQWTIGYFNTIFSDLFLQILPENIILILQWIMNWGTFIIK